MWQRNLVLEEDIKLLSGKYQQCKNILKYFKCNSKRKASINQDVRQINFNRWNSTILILLLME